MFIYLFASSNKANSSNASDVLDSTLVSSILAIISDSNVKIPSCHYYSLPYLISTCLESTPGSCSDGNNSCEKARKLINASILKPMLGDWSYTYLLSFYVYNSTSKTYDFLPPAPIKNGVCGGEWRASMYYITSSLDGDIIYATLRICKQSFQ